MNEFPYSESHVHIAFVLGNSKNDDSSEERSFATKLITLFSKLIPENQMSFYSQDQNNAIMSLYHPHINYRNINSYYQIDEQICNNDKDAILYIFVLCHGSEFFNLTSEDFNFLFFNRIFSKFNGREIIIFNNSLNSGSFISTIKTAYKFDSLISGFTKNKTYKEVILLIIFLYQNNYNEEELLAEFEKASKIITFNEEKSNIFNEYHKEHSRSKYADSDTEAFKEGYELKLIPTFRLLSLLFWLSIPFSILDDPQMKQALHQVLIGSAFIEILNEINNTIDKGFEQHYYIPCCTFSRDLTIIASQSNDYGKYYLAIISNLFFNITKNDTSYQQFYQNHEYKMHKLPYKYFQLDHSLLTKNTSKNDTKKSHEQKDESHPDITPHKYLSIEDNILEEDCDGKEKDVIQRNDEK